MTTPTFIEAYPKALSAAVCNKAIELTDIICSRNLTNSDAYQLVSNDHRKDENIFIRYFGSMEPIVNAIEASLERCWFEYNTKCEVTNQPFDKIFVPSIKIQKSSPGGGFYSWHTEQGATETTKARFAVWMFYLNTVTEGGTTDFKHFNISMQPVQGTCVIWPAAYTHMHRSSPDLKQYKYIATGWFSYEKTNK